MLLTHFEIKTLENWLYELEACAYVRVKRRGYTDITQKYAVVVYCRNLDVFPVLCLTWAKI